MVQDNQLISLDDISKFHTNLTVKTKPVKEVEPHMRIGMTKPHATTGKFRFKKIPDCTDSNIRYVKKTVLGKQSGSYWGSLPVGLKKVTTKINSMVKIGKWNLDNELFAYAGNLEAIAKAINVLEKAVEKGSHRLGKALGMLKTSESFADVLDYDVKRL